ncbi:hypothetical protein Aduo_016994 [Ancylostoma duodenale]
MNALLTLVIASFLIVTVLSEYSGGKCVPAGNEVAEASYDVAPSEGGAETGEGYRRKLRRRVHATKRTKKLRAKAMKKKRFTKKVKKVRRKTVKKNKH